MPVGQNLSVYQDRFMEFNLFYQITTVLVLAGLIAIVVSMLKQPSIIAYILTGLVIGSFGYGQISHSGSLDALGQIGITLLLFMVGLELDLKRIRQLGKVAVYAGLGQIIFTVASGFLIARLFSFSSIASLYIAAALTFSSTVIVIKLLAEKKDLQALYARIVVGVLIVQDFVALGILLFLGGSAGGQEDLFRGLPGWQYVLAMLVKVLILVLGLGWVSKKVFPKFLSKFGKSDELLMIFSLAWALGLAAFMSLPAVGLSLEVGGFVAGLALANSHVHFEIAARVKSLRDFFIIIFFIVFGTKLVFAGLGAVVVPAIVFSLFVLIVKPLILLPIMGMLGYTPRTSFFASVTTAQISEFSFVLVALGNRMGHISDQVFGLVTLVGIITIAGSSYLVTYTRKLYEFFEPTLKVFNFKKGLAEKGYKEEGFKNHIILAGANRLGIRFLNSLGVSKSKLVVVDFDPHISALHQSGGIEAICGDITDPYIQEQVNLDSAKLVISTIPDLEDNLALLSAIKLHPSTSKKSPKLIFLAQNDFESKYLYDQGVDYVLSPHFIGGLHLSKILEEDTRLSGLKSLRKQHLEVLG